MTALLKVSSNIMMSADAGQCNGIALLDLSVTVDTVDHEILINRLQVWAACLDQS